MEAEFRALLTGHAALTALVAQRIYWGTIPQAAADPCVVMYLISSVTGAHMQGSDRLTESIVQIDIRVAARDSQAAIANMWAIRDVIKDRLHAKRITQGNIEFKGIFQQAERQRSDKPGTVLYHTCSLDFLVLSGLVT